jgi:hypothetical protein
LEIKKENKEEMIKLIDILREAFEFFPTSGDQIENDSVKKLFSVISGYSKIKMEDPIVMSDPSSKIIKISRSLQKDPSFVKYLSDKLKVEIDPISGGKWEGVTIKWGDGSRGGRGSKSQGPATESALVRDLNLLREEGISKANQSNFAYPGLMAEMAKELGLKRDNFEVKEMGGKNQKRPLKFSPSGPIIDFAGESVASTLTDITIKKGKKEYYISVKYGNTVAFFNSGVTKALPASEIKSGKITNANGISLLETFGIDNKTFCKVFNEYGKEDFSKENKNAAATNYDIDKIKNLIESGIGSGYYMIHVKKSGAEFYKVDEDYTKTATDVSSPRVYYGGLEGNGKRVDIVIESPLYSFKINIRNKQGGIYPSHIMCDYVKK